MTIVIVAFAAAVLFVCGFYAVDKVFRAMSDEVDNRD